MENYIYNLGLDSAKIMNVAYSIIQSNNQANKFFFGDSMVYNTSPVYPIHRSLPTNIQSITGPLFLQNILSKISYNNSYYSSTGSYANTSVLLAPNDKQYSKLYVGFSGTNVVLMDDKIYQSVSHIDSDLDPNFELNTSSYNDKTHIVFFSKKEPLEFYNDFSGVAADSYEANFTQSPFGVLAGNYFRASVANFSFTSGSLESNFSDLAAACADFAGVDYTAGTIQSEFADNSKNVVDAMQNFADINLNV